MCALRCYPPLKSSEGVKWGRAKYFNKSQAKPYVLSKPIPALWCYLPWNHPMVCVWKAAESQNMLFVFASCLCALCWFPESEVI